MPGWTLVQVQMSCEVAVTAASGSKFPNGTLVDVPHINGLLWGGKSSLKAYPTWIDAA